MDEQLKFYAGLKGVPWSKVNDEIERILEHVGLTGKKSSLAKELSGEQIKLYLLNCIITVE